MAAAARSIQLPGHRTIVLLPTVYGGWPQQALSRRTIGDALAVDSPEDCAAVRAAIEAEGVACGGWSVPRGAGDPWTEGYLQGQAAAQFDLFILNYEQWKSRENDPAEEYWVHPQDPNPVNRFLDGFYAALGDEGRAGQVKIGLTYVTNSMLANAGDDVERAWLARVDFVALEAYYPGDVNLDPANSLAKWARHCREDLGIEPVPACAIVAQGDVVADAAAVSDPELGVQVWTLESAATAAWPQGVLA